MGRGPRLRGICRLWFVVQCTCCGSASPFSGYSRLIARPTRPLPAVTSSTSIYEHHNNGRKSSNPLGLPTTFQTANHLLQVYFKLNAINNCKQPLQQIELNRLFDNAKQAHKVTLRCGKDIAVREGHDSSQRGTGNGKPKARVNRAERHVSRS